MSLDKAGFVRKKGWKELSTFPFLIGDGRSSWESQRKEKETLGNTRSSSGVRERKGGENSSFLRKRRKTTPVRMRRGNKKKANYSGQSYRTA